MALSTFISFQLQFPLPPHSVVFFCYFNISVELCASLLNPLNPLASLSLLSLDLCVSLPGAALRCTKFVEKAEREREREGQR